MISMRRKGGWTGFTVIISIIVAVFMLYIHKASHQEVTEQKHTLKKERRNVLKEALIRALLENNETDITIHNTKITTAKTRSTIVIDEIGNDLSPSYELLTIDGLPTFTILSDYANSIDAINILPIPTEKYLFTSHWNRIINRKKNLRNGAIVCE